VATRDLRSGSGLTANRENRSNLSGSCLSPTLSLFLSTSASQLTLTGLQTMPCGDRHREMTVTAPGWFAIRAGCRP
jgi:hypothetical protein